MKGMLRKAGIEMHPYGNWRVKFTTDSSTVFCHNDEFDELIHMFSRVFFAGKEERSREVMELLRVDDEKSSNTVREKADWDEVMSWAETTNKNKEILEEELFDPLASPESVEEYCKKAGIPYRKGMFIYTKEDRE